MHLGVMSIHLFLPYSNTLKEKRQVVRSLIDRIRNRFNVSVSEVDHQNVVSRSVVAVAVVSGDRKTLDSLMSRIENFVETNFSDVIDYIDVLTEQI